MMEALRNAGRPVRRRAQWLVGQPQLLTLLEEQRTRMTEQAQAIATMWASLEALYSRIRTELAVEIEALDARIRTELAVEIDRLDGYLAYQSDETRRSIAAEGHIARRRIIPVGEELDVLITSQRFDFVVPTREVGLLTFLARHGAESVEPGVRAVLGTRLRADDVVVDVGANIGLHAVAMAAAVGPGGRVLCFEPLSHVSDALRRTLLLNGFSDRSEVHPKALSDETGTAELFVDWHSPNSSLFPLGHSGSAAPVRVEVTTLDEVIPSGGRVDAVKIDVEGAEPRVWRGMRRVRDENRRLAVVIEWSASHFARSGEIPADFLSEILSDGFDVSVIDEEDPGRVVPVGAEEAASLEGTNLLLLRGD
jgi:FkbM family methyltransferase